jgi:putative oxidoreductase
MLITIKTLLARTRATCDRLTFLGPALARLTLGLIFIGTGWGKLHSLGDVTQFFASLHIPAPGFNARLASVTEFVGGILLLVGLGTRLAALPVATTMAVAILTAKRAELGGLTDLVGFDEWTYLVMCLWLVVAGPGPLSLDALIARFVARRAEAAAELPKPLLRPQTAAHE